MQFRADITRGLEVLSMLRLPGIGIRKMLRLVTMIRQDLDMDTSVEI